MTTDSGWISAREAVLRIAFGADASARAETDRGRWWDRWGSLPSWCGTRHEVAWGIERLDAGEPIDQRLAEQIAALRETSGKSDTALAKDIAADLETYRRARQREIEAETILKDAAAAEKIQIWGHPVDTADMFEQQAVAGSQLAPIKAEIFAQYFGGFRWLGFDSYGAQWLSTGFNEFWTGGTWTQLQVKTADVMRLWPARRVVAETTKRLAFSPLLEREALAYTEEHRLDKPHPIRRVREAAILAKCPESLRKNHPSRDGWTEFWARPEVPPHWRQAGSRGGNKRKSKRN